MKKLLSLILTFIMMTSFVGCSSESEVEPAIAGSWKCISVIADGKESRMGENTFQLTINSDGSSTNTYNQTTVDCQWRFDSKDETTGVCKYSITSEEYSGTVYYNFTDTLIFCKPDGEDIIAYIFAKSGKSMEITDETDYNQLLGLDIAELGVTYITDTAAYRKISGTWIGTGVYTVDTNTSLLPGMITLSISETSYTVNVIGETNDGGLTFSNIMDGMPTFDIDGYYEGAVLVYDEANRMLMLYEEESEAGILFVANS